MRRKDKANRGRTSKSSRECVKDHSELGNSPPPIVGLGFIDRISLFDHISLDRWRAFGPLYWPDARGWRAKVSLPSCAIRSWGSETLIRKFYTTWAYLLVPAPCLTINDSLPGQIWNTAKLKSDGFQSAAQPTAGCFRPSTLVRHRSGPDENPAEISAQSDLKRDSVLSGELMNNHPIEDNEMPLAIDFQQPHARFRDSVGAHTLS